MANTNENILNSISNMTVIELAELVKAIEAKFGVSAAAPAAVAAAPQQAAEGGASAAASEKAEFKVELTDGGPDKIKTIKALRQVTTLGLAEAKKAVEEAPSVLAEAASKADANKIKQTLEEAGAKVKLS